MLLATNTKFIMAFYLRVLLIVWVTSPAICASNPATKFVGSDQCVKCHQTEYSQWQLSDHHRAMQRPDKKNVLGNFKDITVEFHGIKTRFYRLGNDFMVATVGKDGKPGVFKTAGSDIVTAPSRR